MRLAEQFTNLGEEFLGSFDARVNFLGQNIVDVKNHKLDAHRFLNNCKKAHKAMGKNLRAAASTSEESVRPPPRCLKAAACAFRTS